MLETTRGFVSNLMVEIMHLGLVARLDALSGQKAERERVEKIKEV